VEETPQISVACLSQQSGLQYVLCILLNKFKILLKKPARPISPEKHCNLYWRKKWIQ
jgi:hypothetical protein